MSEARLTDAEKYANAVRGFWKRVDRRGPDECWPWLGSVHKENGYGTSPNRLLERAYAHRIAYELTNGRVSDDLKMDHLCRNRLCVNPGHLEPVTDRENTLRGVSPAASRARQTHCKRGHEFTPANTYVNISGWRSCRECHSVAQSARYHRLHSAEARGRIPWSRNP